jgi:molybdopterin synthase catalytic subunit
MDAVRYVVEELKRRVPIWKREHYADGTREWVDPTAAAAVANAAAGAAA